MASTKVQPFSISWGTDVKSILATWLKEPVGALRLSYPLDLSEDERLLVERLGTIFGFVLDGEIWTAPMGGEDLVAWRSEVKAAGFETEFRDQETDNE